VLKEIQRHFVIRTSAVIDDETDRLRISELCGRSPDTVYGATDDVSSLIASFQKAIRLADRQYAGDLWAAEMNSSGEAMDRASRVPECERAGVIQEQLNAWREDSADVVRVWAPKFFLIARSFPKQVSEAPSLWAKAKLLEGVNRRLRPAQLGAVTFWMKAACGERDKKDFDPSESQEPWRVPTWFVTRQTARLPKHSLARQPLHYRSPIKRAVLLRLNQCPKATDSELLAWMDEEDCTESPAWLNKKADRSFLSAYKDPNTKHRLESTISKVRTDMRKQGLL
jgi:hypothetical protein